MPDTAKGAVLPPLVLSLTLTNRAARSAVQLLSAEAGEQLLEDADLRDEAASLLRRLFGNGRPERYAFAAQNGGQGKEGDTVLNLWLSPAGVESPNAGVLSRLRNWTLVLTGTARPRRNSRAGDDFLLIDIVALPPWSLESLADALRVEVAFDWEGRYRAGIPDDVASLIATLTPRRLPRNRVRLLLSDWERFLKVSERLAEEHTFALRYTSRRLDLDGCSVRFRVTVPDDFDRRRVRFAAKEDIHLEVPDPTRHETPNGRHRDPVVGSIKGLQGDTLTVRLGEQMVDRLRADKAALPRRGRVAYKALGEVSQVRRLRWGLESLIRGRSTNSQLGEFLFDANEAGLPDPHTAIHLTREELLQPELNDGQLGAVEGALNAPDFFLIQGPPGTGKTTVIAEICYQTALRGGRTMVASQANLAVDHAMSRLVHHPAIRALRRGRAERVEAEGQPYLEDYVIGTWLSKVAGDCRSDLEVRRDRLKSLEGVAAVGDAADVFAAARDRYGRESRSLRATARKARADRQSAELALAMARDLQIELAETLRYLTDLGAAPVGAVPTGDVGGDALPLPSIGADAWSRVWESAISDGFVPLQALEDALALWTAEGDEADADTGNLPRGDGASAIVGEDASPDPGAEGALDTPPPRDRTVFADFVDRGWHAHEMAARILSWVDEAIPKIDVLTGLCDGWYTELARAQPILDRQQLRRSATVRLRSELRGIEQEIAHHKTTIENLRALERDQERLQHDVSSWLLRRATAEGPTPDVPRCFEDGLPSSLWESVVEGQRLPSLRGLATRARQDRAAAGELGLMVGQIERCVRQLAPRVASEALAAAERTPPDWRQTGLAHLVLAGEGGTLRPAPGAEQELRPLLRSAIEYASTPDPILRLPADRVAANVVGLRALAADLRDSRAALGQSAARRSDEFQGLVNRLSATLAARLRQTMAAEQRRLAVAIGALREEMGSVAQELAAIPAEHEEETQMLERLARDRAMAERRLAHAVKFGQADRLLPFQGLHRVARDAVSTPPEVWEQDWRAAQSSMVDARASLSAAAEGFDLDAILADLRGRGEAALETADGECAAAEGLLATSVETMAQAEASLSELEEQHSAARAAWLAAYQTLSDIDRPETQSPTSSETLALVRTHCAKWQDERDRLQAYLDTHGDFISDWIGRVASPSPRDEEDLRQIYIDNANVIGITCVQAGGRAFSQRYRDFDTVIIDEVSKATPPELLLPMLKGSKVVLVGDSRQLPPMVGSDALKDLAESLKVGQRELSHLERSLFRDLFERAPQPLKAWLTEQYRMHPQIMDAINQFYNEKLVCAIPSPDQARAHGLAPLVPDDTHIAWVATPWSRPFYETRVGTSRRNDKEIDVVSNLVQQVDKVWTKTGKPPKEIGVITFYAAQERALRDRLLTASGDQRYDHLNLRLGTVDRFQGMEKPIIIVSLVCNNDRRDIGFARALERINVAFSRAQELLVIVGSRELFCREAAAARAAERYSRVAEVVRDHGGDLDVSDFITT